jgi:hypothetical protein
LTGRWLDKGIQHNVVKLQTWLMTTPRSPTIILRQITSHLTTKDHESLKKVKKSAKLSTACCSARRIINLAAWVFESSAAELRMSESSSWRAIVLGGVCELKCHPQ